MKIGIIGMGKSGQAALKFFLKDQSIDQILLYDDKNNFQGPLFANLPENCKLLKAPDDFQKLKEANTLVVSPGVNAREERFAAHRQKCEIISELELAARNFSGKVIAITGTNGKSTTTALCYHLFHSAGFRAQLAGNIGNPWIEEVIRSPQDEYAVLEVSSFQLEEIDTFHPQIAILTNLTPDHLDRYPDLNSYYQAKLNIFKNQTTNDYKLLNASDKDSLRFALHSGQSQPFFFSLNDQPLEAIVFWKQNQLIFRRGQREDAVTITANPLKGVHNLENITAAFAAGYLAGISPTLMVDALSSFRGLPHRMELVARIGKVNFYNDSKATNVDSALKSILGFERNLVVILGGKHKGSSYLPLRQALQNRAKAVLLIGKAAEIIARELKESNFELIRIKDLHEAVEIGYQILSVEGGDLLLAPACSSFDMFKDYIDRGETFAREVLELKKRKENGPKIPA